MSAIPAAYPCAPGRAILAFERARRNTVIRTAFATSPVRILAPNNHGSAAWAFLASFGGGLVDGDRLDVDIEVAPCASALLGTQGFTKVYRSPHGCSQRLVARVADAATLTVVPDPVVCFAGARYTQRIAVDLARDASVLLLEGYTCGRSARGVRWQFSHYASRTTILRGGARVLVDATRLDPADGPVAERMGRFDVVLSLVAIGPRFARVREAMFAPRRASSGASAIVAASPIGHDGGILRILAESFESASRALRSSFAELARLLGDDPFARKW
jgi:urease accessory protein